MKTRILSGAVLSILAIVTLYFGGYVTAVAILLLSLGGEYELLRIYKLNNKLPGYITYIATVCYYAIVVFGYDKYILPMLVVYILVSMSVYVILYPKYTDKDVMSMFLAFFYVGFLLSYVYLIRELKYGGGFVILIFICSWINDTFAYFTGVTLGKHKMSPVLSPKKSVEGLIGGLVSATVIGAGYGIFFREYVYDLDRAPIIFAIVGLVGAVFAVIGDLAASAIKRNNEIKDYGKLIPGHGGILDRFDSMIFTAPIIYYGMVLLIELFGGI